MNANVLKATLQTKQIPTHVSVLIAGGGPVGLSLAALLAKQGIAAWVIEADTGYCTGSRAICVARRSQEIFSWLGAEQPLLAKGLPWVGGRSYFRDQQVLHFQMQTDLHQRFAPMLNIQQYYIEQFAHQAFEASVADQGLIAGVLWQTKVVKVLSSDAQHNRNQPRPTSVVIEHANGEQQTITSDWLVACDGGKSLVREQLNLRMHGTQYEGRYVIVDIEQKTKREVERLAWFDPPSNPGSTLLMHRQPDDVWRIDYQLADHEDSDHAIKPEQVLPRVQSHLTMMGEHEPWKPLWISMYNAKCLSLEHYRHGSVLFCGDAGHLVPIFGVRGLNSGLDDAANLAWKLAAVVRGQAQPALLDSFSQERVHATAQNISYGAKSTEFMAPPHAGFDLMRQAALRLAMVSVPIAQLINPRQSTPIEYLGSALNGNDSGFKARGPSAQAKPGMPAPEAQLSLNGHICYLSSFWASSFTLLQFVEPDVQSNLAPIVLNHSLLRGALVKRLIVALNGSSLATTQDQVIDTLGLAADRFGAQHGSTYLIRPDGYVAARWHTAPSQIEFEAWFVTRHFALSNMSIHS
jgi:3-(3-hydroxy-phenyl)propionate hydroxylase